MSFFICGLNHRSTPLTWREHFAKHAKDNSLLLDMLKDQIELKSSVWLNTCNRMEFYGNCLATVQVKEKLLQCFSSFFQVDIKLLGDFIYFYEEEAAIIHGFRVAASLDSMMLGESQILGQFKKAYEQAQDLGSLDGFLNKYFHHALHVAKRVRSETDVGKHAVSFGYTAATLAKQIFSNIAKSRLLLLGAGKMGALTLRHFMGMGVQEVIIANRTLNKAQQMAEIFNGTAIALDSLEKWLVDVDIVIASAETQEYLITYQQIEKLMKLRPGKLLFFVDIGIPRNIDPRIESLDNVYLYNLDDLGKISEESLAKRNQAVLLAENILQAELQRFKQRCKEQASAPLLKELQEKYERIRYEEIEKYLQGAPLQTENIRELLNVITRSIMNKYLHDPLQAIKTSMDDSLYQDFVKEVFHLEKKE